MCWCYANQIHRSVSNFFIFDLRGFGKFPVTLLDNVGSIRKLCGHDFPASSWRFCIILMSGSFMAFSCFLVRGGGTTLDRGSAAFGTKRVMNVRITILN